MTTKHRLNKANQCSLYKFFFGKVSLEEALNQFSANHSNVVYISTFDEIKCSNITVQSMKVLFTNDAGKERIAHLEIEK
jgi:hypothetical protein